MKRPDRQCAAWETATKSTGFDYCCQKPNQRPNTCFEKQFNKKCTYSESPNIGDNGKTYSVASQAVCSKICEASPDCVAFNYIHWGQHSGGLNAQGSGACYYRGGTVIGTEQDLSRSCYVKHIEYCNNCEDHAGLVFTMQDTDFTCDGLRAMANSDGCDTQMSVIVDNFKASLGSGITADMYLKDICPIVYTDHCETCATETDLALKSEQALSSNGLAESSILQTTQLPDTVTYVFAAIGFLSVLYVGAKHGMKAFSRSDYAEV